MSVVLGNTKLTDLPLGSRKFKVILSGPDSGFIVNASFEIEKRSIAGAVIFKNTFIDNSIAKLNSGSSSNVLYLEKYDSRSFAVLTIISKRVDIAIDYTFRSVIG